MRASTVVRGEGSRGYERLPVKCGERTGLPLVPCPKCGAEILELVAAPGSKVPGAIFFKCRFHERDVPRTCPWILFADKYERLLVRRGLIEGMPVISDEVGGLQGVEKDVEALDIRIACFKTKLKKLVDLGKIGVVCCVIVTVCVVVVVIRMFLK